MTDKQFEEYRNLRQERDIYKELLDSLKNDFLSLEARNIHRSNSRNYPVDEDLKPLLEKYLRDKIKEITQQMEAL